MNITWKNCIRICVSVFVLYLCMEYFQNLLALIGVVLNAAHSQRVRFLNGTTGIVYREQNKNQKPREPLRS